MWVKYSKDYHGVKKGEVRKVSDSWAQYAINKGIAVQTTKPPVNKTESKED